MTKITRFILIEYQKLKFNATVDFLHYRINFIEINKKLSTTKYHKSNRNNGNHNIPEK